jgi:hypothetical protein
MSARWFRVYDDLIDDPKVQRLPAELFRALINLWCLASKGDGELPPMEDVAYKLRVSVLRAAQIISKLGEAGLLDAGENGPTPHNWSGRQYKSDVSTERVKRFRKRHETVSATPPDTESEQRQSQNKNRARDVSVSPEAEFAETFWPAYPNKTAKPKALQSFVTKRRQFPLQTIMDGLERYIRCKPPDRQWLNPTTFLNQERFNDQPARAGPQSFSEIVREHMEDCDARIGDTGNGRPKLCGDGCEQYLEPIREPAWNAGGGQEARAQVADGATDRGTEISCVENGRYERWPRGD